MVAAEDRKFFLKEPKYSTMTLQFATRLISPVGAHRVQRVALVFVSGDELSHPEILHWFASETFSVKIVLELLAPLSPILTNLLMN